MSDLSSRPIGVFDSGVGGLTVLRAIADRLPHEDLLYLGDTARVPYGNRGPDTIRRYALNAAHLLIERGVKAIVIACNTASAFARDAVDARFDVPVIGVIDPVARRAAARSTTGSIGVIGTRATIRSRAYAVALQRVAPQLQISQVACPLFVPLAEEAWTRGPVAEEIAHTYLAELADTSIDTLILGCTHYPLLRDTIDKTIQRILPRPVSLLDSALATAEQLDASLQARQRLESTPNPRRLTVLLTDIADGFRPTAERFFGEHIARFEHVDIVDQAR